MDFKWYIYLGFYILLLLSLLIFFLTFIKVFKFTKFWEINITDKVVALPLLESYHVIEQRGEIFTIIKRTEDTPILIKIKENYIYPYKKNKFKKN